MEVVGDPAAAALASIDVPQLCELVHHPRVVELHISRHVSHAHEVAILAHRCAQVTRACVRAAMQGLAEEFMASVRRRSYLLVSLECTGAAVDRDRGSPLLHDDTPVSLL